MGKDDKFKYRDSQERKKKRVNECVHAVTCEQRATFPLP